MKQFVFIWSPYQGQPGQRQLIDCPLAGTQQQACDVAHTNQRKWRQEFGEGQVIIAEIFTYLGLAG